MKSSQFLIEDTLFEQKTYLLWESAGKKLVEAQLTAQQIQQLFQQIEQGATAAGGNRTLLGKGKDAASAVNKAWEDLKTKVQNSGPIKNVDAMYDKAAEQLKQATGGDQGVMKYVQKYRDFAKKHPVAQSLIYSALIAGAGISGAGLGGAAALGLFKMVDKLLQGEKFSSATYSGAKTGAAAYAAGQIGQAMKGKPDVSGSSDNVEFTTQATGQTGDYGQPTYNIIPKDSSGAASAPSGSYSVPAPSGGNAAAFDREWADANADWEGAAAKAAKLRQTKESKNLSESQIYFLFGKIIEKQKLDEGIMDTLKGAASKAGSWLQTKGANLTTKVTADKLLQAWKKAGSPTDSNEVANVLRKAGVADNIISSTYSGLKIPAPVQQPAQAAPQQQPASASQPTQQPAMATQPAQAPQTQPQDAPATTQPSAPEKKVTAYKQINQLIPQLNKTDRAKLIRLLKKELGVTEESLDENLHKWFKEKWVRFGPDGKIRGACARGDDSEGKPKCLPQSKAHSLGKKGRASAAARKRREDPNPERSGKAINVATKKKSNEGITEGNSPIGKGLDIIFYVKHQDGSMTYANVKDKAHLAQLQQKYRGEQIKTLDGNNPEVQSWLEKRKMSPSTLWPGNEITMTPAAYEPHPSIKKPVAEEQLDELKCWPGYHRVKGTKAGFPGSCAKNKTNESEHKCPHCGGELVSEELMNEKKDACYYKVKSRYKVWPSAYASGALVKCRKKGASNWGTGGKKNESKEADYGKDYQAMVKRVGQKAKEQEKTRPVDIEQLAKRMRDAEKKLKEYPEQPMRKDDYLKQADILHDKMMDAQRRGDEKEYQKLKREYLDLENVAKQGMVPETKSSNIIKGLQQVDEKWSEKYKRSINCNNPKGFSQRAHCQGRKK